MFWTLLLSNLVVLVIGYFIGSVNISIIYSHKSKKEDIREKGSLNAGATNALRVYGWKAALPIFLFDVLKSLFAVLLVWGIVQGTKNTSFGINYLSLVIPQVAGLGVVIGHIWPIFFKFKGGKGAASMAGLILSVNLVLFLAGIVIFIGIVYLTKYVSLGSILAPFILCLLAFIPWIVQPPMGTLNQQFKPDYFWITGIVLLITQAFVIYSHKKNIHRLLTKTENKLGAKKKV